MIGWVVDLVSMFRGSGLQCTVYKVRLSIYSNERREWPTTDQLLALMPINQPSLPYYHGSHATFHWLKRTFYIRWFTKERPLNNMNEYSYLVNLFLQLQMLHAAAESVTTKIFQQQKELCFYSSENWLHFYHRYGL